MAQSFRILLVEDDDSLRACLGEFLASQGWGVASTAFANEALTLMSRHRFDFGLLDFHLPETTGPELLLQLGAVRPLPSILMSGLANPAEVAAAQQAGFFTFLRKPLDLNRLRQSLEMLIQQHFGGPLAPLDHPGRSPAGRPQRPLAGHPQHPLAGHPHPSGHPAGHPHKRCQNPGCQHPGHHNPKAPPEQ